jgi:hypothetical protein
LISQPGPGVVGHPITLRPPFFSREDLRDRQGIRSMGRVRCSRPGTGSYGVGQYST